MHMGIDKAGPGANQYRAQALPRQFTQVLMSRPDYFAISEDRNLISHHDVPVDLPRALRQWENLCQAFQCAGLTVSLIDPSPAVDYMCFPAGQAFVGIDREDRSFAVPSRKLHRSIPSEVEPFADWYCRHGYRILDLALDGEEFLEGAADLLWDADWNSVWAGFGHRSTRAAVDQFAIQMEAMGFQVHKLELVDPHFFHLDLCLAPLAAQALLIYPGAFAPETLARIRNLAETFEVPREEAVQFVCNGIAVNGYYITPRLTPRLEQILGRQGIEPIIVEVSEFEKAGASIAALKMLLP
jgi:N-dimethylarginine dimethylaminohydrolase